MSTADAVPDETVAELVRALGAVNQHVPRLISGLLTGGMPPVKQHEFASLLIELGELLHQHADDHTGLTSRDLP